MLYCVWCWQLGLVPAREGKSFSRRTILGTSSRAQAGPAAVICVCNKNCKKGRDFYFFAQLQHDQREGTGHTDTENRGQKYISISTVIYARQVGGSGGSKNWWKIIIWRLFLATSYKYHQDCSLMPFVEGSGISELKLSSCC